MEYLIDKYESVSQTAQRYGFTRRQILEFCNSRGQKFAFKPNGGKFWIDRRRFKEFLDRKTKGG